MKRLVYSIVPVLIYTVSPHIAAACPVCFGAKDSPMTAGMNAAILTMLGITGSMLLGIVTIFFILWRRSKRRQIQLSQEVYINQDGILRRNHQEGIFEWNNI